MDHASVKAASGAGVVTGVILAAGISRRFGKSTKQLMEFGGETLLRRVTQQACQSTLSDVVVVVGYKNEEVSGALRGLNVRFCENMKYKSGISGSIQAGLGCLERHSQAVMFLTADQPFLSREVIDRLVTRYRQTLSSIVVPFFMDKPGSPVIFDRSMFSELRKLKGEDGGRVLIKRYPKMVDPVVLENDFPLLDIDTLDDYEALTKRLRLRSEGNS
jgi:molybdenum cofactor cytidylyltransferase